MKKILNEEEAGKLVASLVKFAVNNIDKVVDQEMRKGFDGYPELTVKILDNESYRTLNECSYVIISSEFTAPEAMAEIVKFNENNEE